MSCTVRLELERLPDPPDRRLATARSARPSTPATSAWRSPGVDSSVATTTSSTWSSGIDGGRPGRGSSTSPSSRGVDEPGPPLVHRRLHRPAVRRDLLVVPPSAQRQHDPAPAAPAPARTSPAAPSRVSWPAPHRSRPARLSAGPSAAHHADPPNAAGRTCPPRHHRRPTYCQLLGDRSIGQPLRTRQNNPRAQRQPRRTRHPPAQRSSVRRSSSDSTISTARGPGCDMPYSIC